MTTVPTIRLSSIEAGISHDRQRASRAQQAHAEVTARALPDDLFADDPEIQRLTRAYDTVATRVKRLERLGHATRADAQAAVTRLEQDMSQVQKQIRGAAVDDALDGDFTFPRSSALFRHSEDLRRQLEGARLASEVFAKSVLERNHFDEELSRAREALLDALLERKRAHVDAHPELLEGSSAVRAVAQPQPSPVPALMLPVQAEAEVDVQAKAEAGLDTDAELASPGATFTAEEGRSAVLSGEDAP